MTSFRNPHGAEIVTIRTPGGAPFSVAKPHADRFLGFLTDLEGTGYKIDPGQSGGYSYRNIRGSNRLSEHAHGNAIDLNWGRNPMGAKGHDLPANIAELAAKHGLKWGAAFNDPMHFQVASTTPPVASATPAAAGPTPPGPATMASPPMTGQKYTPEDIIRGRQQFANQLWDEPQASSHPLSVLAQALRGGVSGLYRTGAEAALTGNQDMTQAAMRNAAGAPDTASMASILMGSGVPKLGETGMSMIAQDRRAEADRAADLIQKEKLLKLQGAQSLEHAKQMLPMEMQKAEELARLKAKIESEARDKMLESLGLKTPAGAPQPGQPGQPSAGGPQDDPYLTMTSPTRSVGEEADKRRRAATALALGQEAQASKIMTGDHEPKEYQTKDASLAARMIRSELDMKRVTPLDPKGNFTKYDPTGASQRLWWDDSYWNSNEWKEYQRGTREWIAALLRKDTGAAVTETEWKLYMPTYFPVPGDSPQVVLDKQRARMSLARGMRAGSGVAFEQMFPQFDQEMRRHLAVMDPETYGDKRGVSKPAGEAAAPTAFDNEVAIPEGARVKDEQGRVLIKRNGKLIPLSAAQPQAAPVAAPSIGNIVAP